MTWTQWNHQRSGCTCLGVSSGVLNRPLQAEQQLHSFLTGTCRAMRGCHSLPALPSAALPAERWQVGSWLDSSLPFHLITAQLPHRASQAPAKIRTHSTWANAQFSCIQPAFQHSLQEYPETKSQELSLRRPYLAPKQVLATPWTTRNHHLLFESKKKLTYHWTTQAIFAGLRLWRASCQPLGSGPY